MCLAGNLIRDIYEYYCIIQTMITAFPRWSSSVKRSIYKQIMVILVHSHLKPVILQPPLRVTFPEKPVPPSDSVYKVWSTPRGRVLILNYEKFKGKLENRQGATRDTCMLKNLFEEVSHDFWLL